MLSFKKKFLDYLLTLTVFGFMLFFLLIFIYAFYRSNFFPDNISDRYLKYYLISITGFVFFLITFFLNKKIKKWITFSTLSLCFSLFCLEIILDNFEVPKGSLKEKILAAKELNIDYDHRTGRNVLNHLQKQGVDIISGIYPQSFNLTNGISNENIFPLSGISNKKTLHCNESGQWKYHISDKYGFSNLNQDWNIEELDFLVVGDQFSQGSCVDQDKSIPQFIKMYTKKNLINLSMVGNGPLLKLASLKEYGLKFKPKKVLWFYYEGNDLVDELPREKQSKILLSYLKNGFSQGLVQRQKYLDLKLGESLEKDKILWKTKVFRLYNLRSLFSFDSEHIDYKVDIDPLFRTILLEAKKTVASWGGKIEFIYVPQFERYKKNIEDKWKKNEILDLVKKLDIKIIDLDKNLISKDPDPLRFYPFKMHGTFVVEGNNLIGEFIAENLVENKNE